ncbi:MAG: amino acid permease [Gemmatimonadales bacterium]|nr:MAG: amino acid permease [Gemmatimonadales bacterium]
MKTDTSDLPGTETSELNRELGFFAVFATATGTMIGAGIFILPGIAAAGAGPGAALSFLLAGLVTSIAAMSVSELATAMPKAGGDYYFVSRATGPLVGTMVGAGAWLALVLKGSFALVGLGQYVLHFSPVPVLLTAAAGGILLTLVNLVGAKASGTLQNFIVVALLAIMVAFAVFGLAAVEREIMSPYLPFGWSGVFATTGVVFISYLGVMKAAAISEEVKDPQRNLPLGILTSVAVVTLLYVLTMVIVTGVLPQDEVVAAPAPLADAAGLFLGAMGGLVIAIAGILATLSTGNAALLSSSRYPFAMARDRLISGWIS